MRPQRPPYIEAFERFTQGKSDQIEAFVAFGVFVSSEYKWASSQATWPTEEMLRGMYARLLHDSELQKTETSANKIVEDYREKLVREHEKKYLETVFQQIDIRAQNLVMAATRRHFWRGVLEAFVGAILWTGASAAVVAAFYFGTIESIFEKLFPR